VPYWIELGEAHTETRLSAEADLHPGGTADKVLRTMRRWRVYHFHDTSQTEPVKQKGPIGDDIELRPDAGNLASFLYRLRTSHPTHYRRIVDTIRLVAPFFDDFDLEPDRVNPHVIQLEWRQRESDAYFDAHSLSDGTLRSACLATLLLQPDPPSLVLVDEPELGLHPFAIAQLADMLRAATRRTQLIVATQSVTLLDQLDVEDLIVVEQRHGASRGEG
jgi:predicted ATPase